MTRDVTPDDAPDADSGPDLPVVEGYESVTPERDSSDVTGSGERDRNRADRSRVAGVLLAAGTGSRFEGGNELLADLDGEPLVRRAARTLADAGLSPRIAVVGHERERVSAAVEGVVDEIVVNEDFARGQATSVRAGVRALGPDVDAAVFALGDMPVVTPASVAALVAAYRDGAGTALAAAHEGRRGNPVLFDAGHFGALAGVSGDVGGRRILLEGDGSALVETGDPGVLRDVDTVADLQSLREGYDRP